jgi:hypothetical protein
VLILACSAFGQAKWLMSGTVSKDGVEVAYRTRIEPPSDSAAFNMGGGTASFRDIWHRYLYHSKDRKYLGYDISIQRQGDRYDVTLLPLSATPERLRLSPAGGWTLVPLPATPGTQALRAGETLAVDLLVNPSTGQKMVDYLTIRGPEQREVYTAEGPARDFSVEDVPLSIMAPRLTVNGEPVSGMANMTGGVSGAAIRFYLPDKGRFVLSLAPHESLGFRRAGEIRGSKLTFTAGGDTYTMDCNGKVAPGDGAYHLYVHHDPDYRPKNPAPPGAFGMDAGDKAAWMIRR